LDPLLACLIFALGLAFGSFLNVCIYRLPLDLSVVHPGSACPSCRKHIAFYDNIPVLSWLILRGRCRQCHARISPRYLMVELLTGAMFLACYAEFGYGLPLLKYCTFGFLLLGLIFTDAETQLLPDKLTLPGIALGFIFSAFVPVDDLISHFLPMFTAIAHTSPLLSIADSIAGAIVGASFIYGAGAIYLHARGVEGMGFGDVKLMAMIGAFLGTKLTIFTIFAGSIAGSFVGIGMIVLVWMKRTRRRMVRNHESAADARRRAWKTATIMLRAFPIPFGVFLGSMAILAFFFGNQFLRWYWRML
jgi:leader peptidase (prepilin peptidase) / N-methyltransferase